MIPLWPVPRAIEDSIVQADEAVIIKAISLSGSIFFLEGDVSSFIIVTPFEAVVKYITKRSPPSPPLPFPPTSGFALLAYELPQAGFQLTDRLAHPIHGCSLIASPSPICEPSQYHMHTKICGIFDLDVSVLTWRLHS